jgi:anti-sigma-K factor RskA
MRTNDLIEMAALDALGLLDESEQAEYEQAFQAASPALRRQIRAEQQRAAEFEASLLPIVEPTESLKSRVLAKFVETKALEEASGTRAVIHRPGRVVPKVRPSRRVSPLWRAASIGLSIAVVVLGVFSLNLQEHNSRLGDAIVVNEFFDKVGTRHLQDTLFDPNTERVILAATDNAPPSFAAEAVLLRNPDWKNARFFCSNLIGSKGDKSTFALVVIDENDQVIETLEQFESDSRWVSFDVKTQSLGQGRLALFASTKDGLGQMLMVTRG